VCGNATLKGEWHNMPAELFLSMGGVLGCWANQGMASAGGVLTTCLAHHLLSTVVASMGHTHGEMTRIGT